MIVDLRFSRFEAIVLAALFGGQFLFTSTEVRYLFIALYLAIALALLVSDGGKRWRLLLQLAIGGSPGERGLGR